MEPDKDWDVMRGVLGRNVYSQFVRQTLGISFTVTITLALGEGMNKNYSFTGLKIMLGEYVLVSVKDMVGKVPALPPISPLPETTRSGTSPVYST